MIQLEGKKKKNWIGAAPEDTPLLGSSSGQVWLPPIIHSESKASPAPNSCVDEAAVVRLTANLQEREGKPLSKRSSQCINGMPWGLSPTSLIQRKPATAAAAADAGGGRGLSCSSQVLSIISYGKTKRDTFWGCRNIR